MDSSLSPIQSITPASALTDAERRAAAAALTTTPATASIHWVTDQELPTAWQGEHHGLWFVPNAVTGKLIFLGKPERIVEAILLAESTFGLRVDRTYPVNWNRPCFAMWEVVTLAMTAS
jgi:hypothetical protein